MHLLENKTALVTGASRGIGRAIAIAMAKAGANIAFTFHSSEEKALELENELSTYQIKAKAYRSDASSMQESEELVKQVLQEFGAIDILVNNAGITRDNLLLRMREEDWDAVMNNNLKSVFNLTKQVIRPMMKQQSGSVINISSIVGITGQAGQANYAASKAGMIGFTKSMARELGSRNVRFNVIAPGFIETEMTDKLPEETKQKYFEQIPMRRFGTGAEVADVAVFLASGMSSYVNGQVLSVCGALHT